MTHALLSKPLFALLLITGVTSLVIALEPATHDAPSSDDLLSDQTQRLTTHAASTTAKHADSSAPASTQHLAPWQRQLFQFKPSKSVKHTPSMAAPVVSPPPVSQQVPINNLATASNNLPNNDASPAPSYAPNMPFTYLGRLVRDDKTTLFFNYQEQYIAIKEGEQIEKDWQLEQVTNDTAFIRYLPTKQVKQLSLSDSP